MTIDEIRQAITSRNFVGWHGLADIRAPGDLFENFPSTVADRPVRHLGETKQAAYFVMLNMKGYYRPSASVRNNELVLFDAMNPQLAGGVAALKKDYGEPRACLDWCYGSLEISKGEWVFPERGITLFLNIDTDKALHIAVYHSTDMETYLSTLRPAFRKERKPLRNFTG